MKSSTIRIYLVLSAWLTLVLSSAARSTQRCRRHRSEAGVLSLETAVITGALILVAGVLYAALGSKINDLIGKWG